MPHYTVLDTVEGGGGAAAPVDAQFWVGAANGTLTAEKDLSGFTGLVLNTAGTPSAAVADVHYLPSDIVATTSLGGDAQTISITVAGNTDEGLVIVGSGLCAAGTITLGFNNDATAPTYSGIYAFNGGNPIGINTGVIFPGYAGPLNFVLEIDARVHDSCNRTGIARGMSHSNTTNIDLWLNAFKWGNTTDEITTVILKGSVAALFKSGFKVKTRRRKVT